MIASLIDAVRSGDVSRVQEILRDHPELVDREAPSSHGLTALHYAVMARMPEMVRTLMQAGANARVTTAGIYALRDAAKPFTMAVERGYDEIAGIVLQEEERLLATKWAATDAPGELRQAFDSGDEDQAIAALERHPEMIRVQVAGSRLTALHVASARLFPRVVQWLLDHGADVNAKAADGSMPLDVAGLRASPGARSARLESVTKVFRDRGAELTASWAVMAGDEALLRRKAAEEDLIPPRDTDGWLLRLAVASDRPEMLKLLLDFGLDPDARARVEDDQCPFTWGMPLYECARYGKHAMAEMLLERGADPNGQVYASGTPLSEAYGQRDERMIALLERHGGKSNASMAGLYRRADLARKLLDEFGDTPLPDDGFSSGPVAEQLLSGAARGGDPEILRMAMERVKIPAGDPRWNGLLQGPLGFWNHWIGPWCHPEWDRTTYLTCFRMILEKSGPPNASVNSGATVLHQIVVMGDHVMPEERIAFASAALAAGARTDLRDDLLLSTPLGWACRWGREDLVQLLLDRGVDAVESSAEPWATPLAWAEKKGHARIADLIRKKSHA